MTNFPLIFQPFQDALRDTRRVATRASTFDIQQHHVEPDPAMGITRSLTFPAWQYPKVNDGSFQARFPIHEQEAWNPFHLTGVPEQPGGSTEPPREKRRRIDPYLKFPLGRYDSEFETEGPVPFLAPPDSGYGSRTSSIATRTIVSSTNATGTTPGSCQIPHNNDQINVDIPSINNSSSANDTLVDLSDPMPEIEIPYRNRKKCDYPGCTWTGKCPSDKRCVVVARIVKLSYRITDIAVENMKQDIRNSSNAMNQTVPVKMGLGPLMTLNAIRNVCTTKSQTADPRRNICALERTALERTNYGLG